MSERWAGACKVKAVPLGDRRRRKGEEGRRQDGKSFRRGPQHVEFTYLLRICRPRPERCCPGTRVGTVAAWSPYSSSPLSRAAMVRVLPGISEYPSGDAEENLKTGRQAVQTASRGCWRADTPWANETRLAELVLVLSIRRSDEATRH